MALAGVLLLVGCKDDPPGSGSSATDMTTRATLTVLEAGAEPRRALAYAPEGGVRAPTIRWEMVRKKEGAPPIGYEIGVRWAVIPNAKAPWTFSVTGIEHLGPGREGMGKDEQAIVDGIDAMFAAVEGRGAITASGMPVFEQTAGLSTRPSLPAVLDMLTVPLPVEPVGVGARWEVTDPGEDGGPWVYELTALEEERVAVRATSETTRKGFEESVEGTMTIGFDDLLPIEANVEILQVNEMKPPPQDDGPSEPVRLEVGFELELR